MPMKFNPCRPCCTTPQCGTITFIVRGCNATGAGTDRLPGATVTIYDGNNNTFPVLASGVTNSVGQFIVPITVSKSYFYTISASRFNLFSGTVSPACTGSSNTNVFPNLTVANATLHVCTPGCPMPLARTLHMNTPAGIVTLTYGGLNNDWSVLTNLACGQVRFNVYSGNGASGTAFTLAAGSSGTSTDRVPTTKSCPTVASPSSLSLTYTVNTFGTCWTGPATLTLTE